MRYWVWTPAGKLGQNEDENDEEEEDAGPPKNNKYRVGEVGSTNISLLTELTISPDRGSSFR